MLIGMLPSVLTIQSVEPFESQSSVDWWPMFCHDLSRSGYSTSTGPSTNRTIWSYTPGGSVQSSPAVADGKVYVGSDDAKVYCLDALTGTKIWSYTTGGGVDSPPAVAGGKVYVGSYDSNVYCLRASDGAKIWNYTTGGPMGYVYSSPAVADGKVYVGSCDGKVYAFGPPPNYTLTITATAGGTTNPSPGAYTYVDDSSVEVTAIPDAYYMLDHWELDGANVGSANPYTVHIDKNHTLHAVFAQINYTLTITTTAGGTTDPSPGTHTYAAGSSVEVTAIPDTYYTFDHWELDGLDVGSVNPYSVLMDDNHTLHAVFISLGIHDVAVTNVTPSKTVVGQGYSTSINVTVENQGDFTETFNVTVFYNETAITLPNGKNHTTTTLTSGNSTTITFTWNTTGIAKGNYTISAYATPVSGETNLDNNTFVDGWVVVTIKGDVDGDFDVDIYDVVKITGIYRSKRGDPQFNPNSDLDDDGEITIYDVVRCTSHYGQEYP